MVAKVRLDIMPDRIDPEQWALAYDETLHLLQSHPSRLFGLHRREIGGKSLHIYCRDLEANVGKSEERHWCVAGDLASMVTADAFTMYRDLRGYQRSPSTLRRRSSPSDILHSVVEIEARAKSYLPPVRVFGGVTEGTTIHIALLAAGMLIEERFAPAAIVSGDIDRGQAEAARALAQSILGRAIALPVLVDSSALLTRLRGLFPFRKALTAVEQLYLREPSNRCGVLAALLAQVPRKQVELWFVRELRRNWRLRWPSHFGNRTMKHCAKGFSTCSEPAPRSQPSQSRATSTLICCGEPPRGW